MKNKYLGDFMKYLLSTLAIVLSMNIAHSKTLEPLLLCHSLDDGDKTYQAAIVMNDGPGESLVLVEKDYDTGIKTLILSEQVFDKKINNNLVFKDVFDTVRLTIDQSRLADDFNVRGAKAYKSQLTYISNELTNRVGSWKLSFVCVNNKHPGYEMLEFDVVDL